MLTTNYTPYSLNLSQYIYTVSACTLLISENIEFTQEKITQKEIGYIRNPKKLHACHLMAEKLHWVHYIVFWYKP